MRVSPLSKRAGWAALTWGALAVTLLVPALGANGRGLTPAEMRAAFGDGGTDPCVQAKTCNYAVQSGAGVCSYCSSNDDLSLCCNQGTGTKCEYTGTARCDGDDYYYGTISGQPGTCGSCQAKKFNKDGQCTGTKDAEGDGC